MNIPVGLERALYYPALPLIGRFFAGPTLAHAYKKRDHITRHGFRAIVNYLGEDQTGANEIARATRMYSALATNGGMLDVSLKLTQFGVRAGKEVTQENREVIYPELKQIFEISDTYKTKVWIDAERLQLRSQTWFIGSCALDHADFIGIAFQAYGTEEYNSINFFDNYIEPLVRSLPAGKTIGLRLCKGAYTASETAILRDKNELRTRYIALIERVIRLANWSRNNGKGIFFPEFATHDPYLITSALKEASRQGVPPQWYRFAMLLGREQDAASHLIAEGYTVAVDIPFGERWLRFFARRIKEKPSYALMPFRSEGKYHRCETYPETCVLDESRIRNIMSN